MTATAERIPNLNTSGGQYEQPSADLWTMLRSITDNARVYTVNTGSAVLLDSVYGQQLLESLAAFIQHVVQPHVKKAEGRIDSAEASTRVDPAFNTAFSSPTLLGSLANFVHDVVASGTPILAQGDMSSVQAEVRPKTDLVPSNVNPLSSTHTMSDDFKMALKSAKDGIEKIVYNDMPIRLLAFDENGNGIRLIERNEVVRHIMDCTPEQLDSLMAQYNDGANPQISVILRDYFASRAKYAILSHTWIRDIPSDVIYADWSKKEQNPRGLEKITRFCKVSAQDHGITLAWMDTVCINKNSSSELDESIGSMYKWYRDSAVCVAYLSEIDTIDQMHVDSWFKRGWTLQELLAPTKVEFYNKQWTRLVQHADKPLQELTLFPVTDEEHIQQQIQTATSITQREISLCRLGQLTAIPIGRKMQMAIGRRVTRVEDSVYSLMGLLGVKISIAYGEGEKSAFNRILRELINTQQSILDIFNSTSDGDLLPNSLDAYKDRYISWDNTTGYGPASWLDQWKPFEPLTVTHLGCRIPLLLAPALWTESSNPIPPPYGDFYGYIFLAIDRKRPAPLGPLVGRFDILCGRIYTDEEVTTRRKNDFDDAESPYVRTYGIINFGFDDGVFKLPTICLATVLDFGIKQTGRVDPLDKVSRSPSPACFSLYPSSGNSREIRKDDLGKHGLQLVTMHL